MNRFRPAFHFSPPNGALNDPNGLIFSKGEWHLFFQYVPPNYVLPFAAPKGDVHLKHWGHAVSRDLVSWKPLPPALAPDELGAIWSGSAVVDERDTSGFFDGESGLVAVFTHFHRESQEGKTQCQSLAWSRDNGRSWTKYAGNPVLTGMAGDFRDPKVFFHGPTDRWIMVLSLGAGVGFYTSSDLKSWEFASRFGPELDSPDQTWECPDLFALPVDGDAGNPKWVLQTSYVSRSVFRDGSGECANRHFIGAFDGTAFTPDTQAPTGFGRDDYAAVAWTNSPASDGRVILIGWMANHLYSAAASRIAGCDQLTLPRTLELRTFAEGVRLVQQPVAELRKLRRAERNWENVSLSDAQTLLVPDAGESYELLVEWEVGDAREVGVRVRQKARNHTTIGFERGAQSLFIDRTLSGEKPAHPHFTGLSRAPLSLRDGVLKFQIFVDRSSVEVFADEGRIYGAELIFPLPDSVALELYAAGGAARLRGLRWFALG